MLQEVPQVVVVGDQSHGKTRLVEGISGVELPQGEGTVTKLPLHMKIYSMAVGSLSYCRVRYFGAKQSPLDWHTLESAQVASFVDQLTATYAPNELVLDGSKIEVEVYIEGLVATRTPDLPPILLLSLTDLPGMTRVASKNQQVDIEQDITDLYRRYIAEPSALILNTIAAQVDFSTSTSLKLSRQADPEGERTFIVVTKCDQDVERIPDRVRLSSEQLGIPLSRIFLCMNKPTGINHISLTRKWRTEKAFFERHAGFATLKGAHLGSEALAFTLAKHHAELIRKALPEINRQLDLTLDQATRAKADLERAYGLGSFEFNESTCSLKFSNWSMHWLEAMRYSLRGRVPDELARCGDPTTRTMSAQRVEIDMDRHRGATEGPLGSALRPAFEQLGTRIAEALENTAGVPGMPGARDPNTVMAHELAQLINEFQTHYVEDYVSAHRGSLTQSLKQMMDGGRWPLLRTFVFENIVRPVIRDLFDTTSQSLVALGSCEAKTILSYGGSYERALAALKAGSEPERASRGPPPLPDPVSPDASPPVAPVPPVSVPELKDLMIKELCLQAKAYWSVFLGRFLDSTAIIMNGQVYERLCEAMHQKLSHYLLHPPAELTAWFRPDQSVISEYDALSDIERTAGLAKNLTLALVASQPSASAPSPGTSTSVSTPPPPPAACSDPKQKSIAALSPRLARGVERLVRSLSPHRAAGPLGWAGK